MPQLSSKEASLYASLVFILTILLTFFLPGNAITLSGLLVVIFLSVFVHTKSSTLIAGVISGLIVMGFMIWNAYHTEDTEVWPKFIFTLVLILFTTLLVLYIKGLISKMQFSQSHMTSLFENATEGIILTNDKADIVLVNPAACRMFDYAPEEIIGQKVEVLIPKRYRTGHVQLRDGFYKKPQNRDMGSGRDLAGQRKDGTTFSVEVSLSHYKQNNTQYVIAFVVDITHRKEIEQSMLKQQQQLEQVTNDIRKLNTELEAKVEERTTILKEALQRLEQSQEELSEALDKERQLNEIKSRFVSMASHEFRTPLSAVLSSASLLSKYTTTEEQEKRTRHIERIKGSVKHLNDLLEDFLSLGKLDEGKIGANPVPFNLKEKVSNVADDMRGILKEGQQIVTHHEGSEDVVTDKNLLSNCLINLVSNAVKFSDPGSTIWVKSFIEGDTAAVSVRDEGIGISEEDQQHLFSSFFRGKNALNIQGTGLGLHIVKRYVDLLHGAIELKSNLGKGTEITFTFPINLDKHAKNNIGN
jgi:PAS domain S-box-containing protein